MAEYEDLRQRHVADLTTLMPEHVQRLRWPADRLRQERRDRLRDLLRVAKASSPWHRDRLTGVDPDGFEEADLAGLPPMTKDDLMANWDRVVAPELAAQPMRVAMVGARIATHMTSAMPQTFANPMVDVALFPVTQPIDRIVAGLNAYQPLALMGYPSMLALLAAEARAGRLRILPRRVTTTSEPLLPEVRRALTEAFCAPVANMYGTSEAGPIGVGCFRRPGIHLCDDLVIVEPVDLDGRPVPPGVRSDKLYVTALVNPTLPLIRFELTDQVTFLDGPCPCGSAHQLIADVESRLDDVFTYPGGQVVHPHVFGAQLRRDRGIVEYQVRQTPAGAEVLVVGAPADPAATGRALAAELARLGVPDPAVEVHRVDRLERQPTGKVRRFRPLTGAVEMAR